MNGSEGGVLSVIRIIGIRFPFCSGEQDLFFCGLGSPCLGSSASPCYIGNVVIREIVILRSVILLKEDPHD